MELWHLAVGQGAVLAAIGWLIRYFLKGSNDLAALRQWKIDHEQKDDERYGHLMSALESLAKVVGSIKRGLRGPKGDTGAKGDKGNGHPKA